MDTKIDFIENEVFDTDIHEITGKRSILDTGHVAITSLAPAL